jgi:hypothetical membrane protein
VNGYVVAGVLIVAGLLIIAGSYWYDEKFGRSEEYGTLAVGICGAIIVVAGVLAAGVTAILRAL